MKIAFVTRVYVRLVHCGELVKYVIWEEHILQVLSTAPAPCPWKVVLNPSVFGAYMVEQGSGPLAARGWFESWRYLFFPSVLSSSSMAFGMSRF